MKKVEVVAAIIKYENQILCVQRPQSKLKYVSEKFEFPGGKIEPNETRKEALKRELNEELNLDVIIGEYFMTVIHIYPDFELTMHSFFVEVDSNEIKLNEHISQKWLSSKELLELDWAAADLPIVDKLIKL
ncbi:MAG: 8-oxo-dGTP diphosphatase [Saprospiraceae bacterium]|jgi:8-oxo-dGTP diphosphatase|tara:strand:+ start:589 stop:981 length:393 start_codon:yes stop_codon:yes gene_type:complete